MSLLVLSPESGDAAAWRSRLLAAQVDGGAPDSWDAVLVIDDHSPEALELLARAQALCARQQGPPLAVLALLRVEGAGLEVREPGPEPYAAWPGSGFARLADEGCLRIDPNLDLLCLDFDA